MPLSADSPREKRRETRSRLQFLGKSFQNGEWFDQRQLKDSESNIQPTSLLLSNINDYSVEIYEAVMRFSQILIPPRCHIRQMPVIGAISTFVDSVIGTVTLFVVLCAPFAPPRE